jgi:hypothetical protein
MKPSENAMQPAMTIIHRGGRVRELRAGATDRATVTAVEDPTRVSQERSTSVHTLGAELERYRLERRLGRATVAIALLRQRASDHRREPGALPRHVRQAIADFEAQIAAMNARLGDLAADGGSSEGRPTEQLG